MNAQYAESTDSGTSFHRGDQEIGDLAHRVQPDPDGRYTVDVHVTADGHARIGDRLYTPEEFAEILRRNADYDGRPIRLIGCDAASNDFAHRLSHELGTDVMAPTKHAWTDSHGRVFSSDYEIGPDGRMRPRIPPDGEWTTHHPDGTTHRPSDDGFAPGTHDRDVAADSARARGEEPGWQDKPGKDGKTPRENIADPNYLEKNYYKYTHADGTEEMRVRPGSKADPPPPPIDLVDGKARFKSDRPPAESLGFDESRSHPYPPERSESHGADSNGHEPGTTEHPPTSTSDTPAGEQLPGEHADAKNWREQDYDRIDDKIADRQEKMKDYAETDRDSDDWVGAHNAKNDASEHLGEEAAEHAIRDRLYREFSDEFPGEHFDVRPHPDAPDGHKFQLVDSDGNVRAEITARHPMDGGKPGAGNFDQIWEVDYRNGDEPHFIVHEAKGPGGQASERYIPGLDRTFQQGHPEYFNDIVNKMKKTDPELAAALREAKLAKRLDYAEVRARVDESKPTHQNLGYDYKPYNGYKYRPAFPPKTSE